MFGRILALAGRKPPAEVRLWHAGDNPTDFGVHRWTERSVHDVCDRYDARGNPILIDIDHNVGKRLAAGETPPGTPAVTAGYAELEIRDGEPWLKFAWSDEGAAQIASGQRRFLSPEYDVDEETGEIIRLYRVSLVSDPGTHHAKVLASASRKVSTMIDPVILAALRAALTSEDPKAAIEALLEEVGKGADAGGGEAVEAAPKPEGEGVEAEGGEAGKDKPPEPYAAGAEEPGDGKGKEPVAAATNDPPVTASAKPPSPVVPRLPPKTRANVSAEVKVTLDEKSATVLAEATGEARKATSAVDDLRRDMLLRDQGDKLQPAIRTWASSQPLHVVQGLLGAAPGKLAAPALPNATRGGSGHAGGPVYASAEAKERFKSTAELPLGPVRTPEGRLRIHACCPGEYRNQQAARRVAAEGK